ncbi:MAG: hypothetical protein NC418_04380 [Muribaculaceae bacterium]|nr:hypothetical protein [Muribaculaceae bacterium]
MLNDRLYIDGIDAFATWGIFVVKGGWKGIIAYPPLKTPQSNDWHEEDGIEVDLSEPRLNTTEAQLDLAWTGLYADFDGFINHLADGAYHTFHAKSIGRTFRLRLSQMPSLSLAQQMGFCSLKLCNDFPLDGYQYAEPRSNIARYSDFLLDGRPFTDYGCRILQGSLAQLRKTAAVKPKLLRNIASMPGAIYDSGAVTFKAKDAKLFCLMRADSLTELWCNYDALLFDLVRPGERELSVAALEHTFPCHYKSAAVDDFFPSGKIWLQFTITLTLTRDFRVEGGNFILADEQATPIAREDADNSFDLKPDSKI